MPLAARVTSHYPILFTCILTLSRLIRGSTQVVGPTLHVLPPAVGAESRRWNEDVHVSVHASPNRSARDVVVLQRAGSPIPSISPSSTALTTVHRTAESSKDGAFSAATVGTSSSMEPFAAGTHRVKPPPVVVCSLAVPAPTTALDALGVATAPSATTVTLTLLFTGAFAPPVCGRYRFVYKAYGVDDSDLDGACSEWFDVQGASLQVGGRLGVLRS